MPQPRKGGRRGGRRGRRVRPLTLGLVALVAVAVVVAVALLLGRGGPSSSTQASTGPADWSVASYAGGPRLAVDRTSIDEGSVPYEHPVAATFRLKNVGDRTLTLQPPGAAQVLDGC